ncbi:hypothetical protein Prudu_935S000400 [Prunus dulcis]|uniref:Uncharacterized protein n=1 Tax=Prunus dulcis TaxID=3755 RepID=A0A5H2XMZ4_PRUDU|nr:hypothetical protein Prudu_935S000400 [Prunus dulcis]
MTGPDPISALESESNPVRVRHLANVGLLPKFRQSLP